jgi:hypothetical protein
MDGVIHQILCTKQKIEGHPLAALLLRSVHHEGKLLT